MKKLIGYTETFTATIGSTSSLKGEVGKLVVCLEDIYYKDRYIADHKWVQKVDGFKPFKKGQRIEFKSTVVRYKSLSEDGFEEVVKQGFSEPREIRRIK